MLKPETSNDNRQNTISFYGHSNDMAQYCRFIIFLELGPKQEFKKMMKSYSTLIPVFIN